MRTEAENNNIISIITRTKAIFTSYHALITWGTIIPAYSFTHGADLFLGSSATGIGLTGLIGDGTGVGVVYFGGVIQCQSGAGEMQAYVSYRGNY